MTTLPTPLAAPTSVRRPRLQASLVVGAVLLLVGVGVVVLRSDGTSARGESFASPPQTFAALPSTPTDLHQALVAKPFVAADLPAGFEIDAKRSPGGRLSKAQGFSNTEEDRQHNLVATGVLWLTNPSSADTVFQLTFMSFAEPASANAYVQEVRATPPTPDQTVGDQQVCGVFPPGALIACSTSHENVVVGGVARSLSGDPIPATEVDATLDGVNRLSQAGVARLVTVKGG